MHAPHLPGEAADETPHGLRGEGNLRHQHDRLATLLQGLRHRRQIDFGLARAGHPVQ